MGLEWKDGPLPSDAPDGKYLIRFRNGDEAAGIKSGNEFRWPGSGKEVLECYKMEAHALLEPAAPPKEQKPWPLLARWIDGSKVYLAARINTAEVGCWHVSRDGEDYMPHGESAIPADAERLDPNQLVARVAELECDNECLQRQLQTNDNTTVQASLQSCKLASQLDTLQAENRELRERVEKLRQTVMDAIGIKPGGGIEVWEWPK